MVWDRIPRSSELTYVSVYKLVVGLHLWNGMAKNPKSNHHPQALQMVRSGSDPRRTVNIKPGKYEGLQLDPGKKLHAKFSGA